MPCSARPSHFGEPSRIADDVAHFRRHEQNLGGKDTALSVGTREQSLTDDGAEQFGDVKPRCVLLIGRQSAKEAAERAGRVGRCHLADDETSRFGGAHGEFDDFGFVHFAEHNDVGVLIECRAHAVGEAIGIDTHFALRDGALVVLVQELDGAFDGHDVAAARRMGVQMMHEGGDGARASRPRHAGYEEESVIGKHGRADDRRQPERGERRQHVGNDAHDDREARALTENADAEAGNARRAPGPRVVADIFDRRRVGGRAKDVRDHFEGADGRQ